MREERVPGPPQNFNVSMHAGFFSVILLVFLVNSGGECFPICRNCFYRGANKILKGNFAPIEN